MTFRQHGNKRKGWLLPSANDGYTYLRHVRTERGLASFAAAKLCGISAGHYSSIENAQREVTDLVLPKLESFLFDLGLSTDDVERILK